MVWEEQKPRRTSPEQHLILKVQGRSGAHYGLGGGWELRLLADVSSVTQEMVLCYFSILKIKNKFFKDFLGLCEILQLQCLAHTGQRIWES